MSHEGENGICEVNGSKIAKLGSIVDTRGVIFM
jgi:hypothetical protein